MNAVALETHSTLAQRELPLDQRDDAALVELLRGGDEHAFRVLVRRHQENVYRLALRITRREARAQDVVQDAFLQVFRKIDQFRGQSAFSTWLYRVTVNAALMRMRSDRRRRETTLDEAVHRDGGDEVGEPLSHAAPIDEMVSLRAFSRRAKVAIDALPEIYRRVFELREIEELSTAETAAALHVTEMAVKVRLCRARQRLRDALVTQAND